MAVRIDPTHLGPRLSGLVCDVQVCAHLSPGKSTGTSVNSSSHSQSSLCADGKRPRDVEIYAGTSPGEGMGTQGPREAESRPVSAVLRFTCVSVFCVSCTKELMLLNCGVGEDS